MLITSGKKKQKRDFVFNVWQMTKNLILPINVANVKYNSMYCALKNITLNKLLLAWKLSGNTWNLCDGRVWHASWRYQFRKIQELHNWPNLTEHTTSTNLAGKKKASNKMAWIAFCHWQTANFHSSQLKSLNFLNIRMLTCDKLTGHNLLISDSSITYTWDYCEKKFK